MEAAEENQNIAIIDKINPALEGRDPHTLAPLLYITSLASMFICGFLAHLIFSLNLQNVQHPGVKLLLFTIMLVIAAVLAALSTISFIKCFKGLTTPPDPNRDNQQHHQHHHKKPRAEGQPRPTQAARPKHTRFKR